MKLNFISMAGVGGYVFHKVLCNNIQLQIEDENCYLHLILIFLLTLAALRPKTKL